MYNEGLPILSVQIGVSKKSLPEQEPEGAEEEDKESKILPESCLQLRVSSVPRSCV